MNLFPEFPRSLLAGIAGGVLLATGALAGNALADDGLQTADAAVETEQTSALTDGPAPAAKPSRDEVVAIDEDFDDDPFEEFNRDTHKANSFLRRYLLDPVVDAYQYITPDVLEKGLSNVVSNASEPLTIVSSALQGDFENVGASFTRFFINTTIGFAGLEDVAAEAGLEQQKEDFGQVLATWGVPEGPYIVAPFLGPTNLRDGIGNLASGFGSPVPFAGQVGEGFLLYSENQEALQGLTAGSLDPYATEKTAFQQFRHFQVTNGEAPALGDEGPAFATDLPDLEIDLELEEAKAPDIPAPQ